MTTRRLAAFFAALSMTIACSDDSTSPAQHAVSGTGSVEIEGIEFSVTVDASGRSSGDASGTMSVTLDLTTLSLPVVTFAASVSCLLVDGNEAWFMANVTSTSHPDIIAMGSEHVGYVRDIGGSGTDIMHAEAAADVSNTPLTCADRPVLAQTVVQSGDYTIR